MSHVDVLANARTYLDQFHRIVPRENTRIVNQSEWYASFGLREMFELASRFSAQQLLAREEFKKRQAAGVPIPVKDLLYPLLQAYDSVAIEADVEVGGTDQQFNLLAGRQLQERLGLRPQNVFITHLLEGLDGERMSKTKASTAIWITDEPDEMFGKVMSLRDDLMPHYFEWATDLPLAEIRSLLAALERGELHPRDAKERLARQVVGELHSPEDADTAAAAFGRQFRQRERPVVEPTVLERNGAAEFPIVELLERLELAKSRSEARRLVSQGAVRIDEQKATLDTRVRMDSETFLQVGPRTFRQITWQ
jgi:tyrosyl-tRNA synthetase